MHRVPAYFTGSRTASRACSNIGVDLSGRDPFGAPLNGAIERLWRGDFDYHGLILSGDIWIEESHDGL